tara:strand:- start:426 stop:758 length:333 start_codon:yes stop_codon:yes gene_type:complete
MSETTGQKHTKVGVEVEVRNLSDFVNLKYNNSYGGIFRLAKGKSPLIVSSVMQHEDIILIQCIYLKSGKPQVYKGNKKVVPLKLGVFEDDDEFYPKGESIELEYSGYHYY